MIDISEFYATTFICENFFSQLQETNWFAATNFHDQDVDYFENKIPQTFKHWFATKNIRREEALGKIPRMQIKVALYMIYS